MRCRFSLRQPPSSHPAARGLAFISTKTGLSPGHFLLETSAVGTLASQSNCVVLNLPRVAPNFWLWRLGRMTESEACGKARFLHLPQWRFFLGSVSSPGSVLTSPGLCERSTQQAQWHSQDTTKGGSSFTRIRKGLRSGQWNVLRMGSHQRYSGSKISLKFAIKFKSNNIFFHFLC